VDFIQQTQLRHQTDADLVRQAGYALPDRGMFDRPSPSENALLTLAGELLHARAALSKVANGEWVPDFDSNGAEIAGEDFDTQYWAEQIEVRWHKLRKACAAANTANDQQPGGGQ
jgi:hypothetical protein